MLLTASCGKAPAMSSVPYETLAPGVGYANQRMTNVPWSVHVVRFDRTDPAFEVRSVHAGQGALGLATLTDQIQQLPPGFGAPVAAVNGDFYQRDRAYAGDPRGLQILDGDLVSAPVGGVAFWPDAAGQLHVTNVVSRFQLAWPDGTATSFGVNQDRAPDALVLYTPAIGASTRTVGGREWVLEAASGADRRPAGRRSNRRIGSAFGLLVVSGFRFARYFYVSFRLASAMASAGAGIMKLSSLTR